MLKRTFELSPMFTDHMVLQRDALIPIWGTAENGRKIQVELCGQKKAAVCANGQWRVILMPLPAGGPFTMKISCGDYMICLQDVLLGEVYIAAGQSNMEFPLQDELHGEDAIQSAQAEQIRYYEVPQVVYEDSTQRLPDLPEGSWSLCTPERAAGFSAIAHYFAQGLFEELQVPVGIISCNKGGTSASCWLSTESLRQEPVLRRTYLDPYEKAVADLTEAEEARQQSAYEREVADYQHALLDYEEKHPEAALNDCKQVVGHTPWPPPAGRKCFTRPGGLYQTMLQKLVPYRARAVLWYQGEEDTAHAGCYAVLLRTLLADWRQDFANEQLPFLVVQLPSYQAAQAGKAADSWAALRAAQLEVVRTTEHTGLVVMIDTGEAYNVHPLDKRPAAQRLLRLARAMLYEKTDAAQAPYCDAISMQGECAHLHFHIFPGDALVMPDEGLRGFTLCGRDGIFHPAQAVVTGPAQVEVRHAEIPHPMVVRYAWADYIPEANLFTRAGLAAAPFSL